MILFRAAHPLLFVSFLIFFSPESDSREGAKIMTAVFSTAVDKYANIGLT